MSTTPPFKLLLIEDDEPTARALRVLFHQRTGIDVVWAANLAEGRAQLDEGPDCILLDLVLPDGDGEELMHEINDRGEPRPRAVICTGLPEGTPRMTRVESLRPSAVIHKPYEIDALMAAVLGDSLPNPPSATTPYPKGTP